MKKRQVWVLIRNFALEMVIYALLVIGYFLLVLRLLGDPLKALYRDNLGVYAVAALVLIVAQGVVLEAVTSFIVKLLRLERLD